MEVATGTWGYDFSTSWRTSHSGVSAWSSRTIRRGENRHSCLTSSLPMEPAAPVTITTLPLMPPEIFSMSMLISSRSIRSSICTSSTATPEYS